MPTERLVPLLIDRHDLWNQIPVREELCRRIDGRVLSYFWYHPVCLDDALYEWVGLTWPRGFETLRDNPPALIIWGKGGKRPKELLSGYEVHEGFALRR